MWAAFFLVIHQTAMVKVVVTVFAGRKHNLDVLLRYTSRLRELGHIDEVHLWNFTRNATDDYHLRLNFRQAEPGGDEHGVVSSDGYHYAAIPPVLSAGHHVDLSYLAASDAHLLVRDGDAVVAELCIGGWGNTRSELRALMQGPAVAESDALLCDPRAWLRLRLELEEGELRVLQPGIAVPVFAMPVADAASKRLTLSVANWERGVPVQWRWDPPAQVGDRPAGAGAAARGGRGVARGRRRARVPREKQEQLVRVL
jgi:hypothetical protein